MKYLLLVVALMLVAGIGRAQSRAARAPADSIERIARPFFGTMDGTLVLLDGATGRLRRANPRLAATRVLPASTFKIPNALIALETGVAPDADFTLPWDSTKAPRQPWWPQTWLAPTQTLRSAIRISNVPYFQEIARRVGRRRMQTYLHRFGYGNQRITGPIDRFWLDNALLISADEQVAFLRRLHTGKLGVKPRSTAILEDILTLERTPEYVLRGKTGTGTTASDRPIGWLVGYVERPDWAVTYFALQMQGDGVPATPERVALTKRLLAALGVLPVVEGETR